MFGLTFLIRNVNTVGVRFVKEIPIFGPFVDFCNNLENLSFWFNQSQIHCHVMPLHVSLLGFIYYTTNGNIHLFINDIFGDRTMQEIFVYSMLGIIDGTFSAFEIFESKQRHTIQNYLSFNLPQGLASNN